MKHLLLLLTVALIFVSCRKSRSSVGGKVEIYLLKSFDPVPGKCQIVASTAILQSSPLVNNEDILEYDRATYEYKLTQSAIARIKALMARTPFALTVGRETVYFGMYVPGFISSTCDHSIAMTDLQDKVLMRLGYPGISPLQSIDDQRNNPKLIAALKAQGKLR